MQSVLENWNEAAKTDVVEELLADIYSCAVQQWGVSEESRMFHLESVSNPCFLNHTELRDTSFDRALYWCYPEKTIR